MRYERTSRAGGRIIDFANSQIYRHGRLKGSHHLHSGILANGDSKAREGSVLVAARGFTHDKAGISNDAEAVLQGMEALPKQRFVTAHGVALVHAGLGRNDEALQSLDGPSTSARTGLSGFASIRVEASRRSSLCSVDQADEVAGVDAAACGRRAAGRSWPRVLLRVPARKPTAEASILRRRCIDEAHLRGLSTRWETIMETAANATHREPWSKGKIVGQKAPFKPKDIWALRVRLQMENRVRELALFNLGTDSKLRGCDLVALNVRDICHGDQVAWRAVVMQHKTQRFLQFEIMPAARDAVGK